MTFLLGGMVLVVAVAFHIAWIAKRAHARGRSVLAWTGLGLALVILGVRAGLLLFAGAPDLQSSLLTFLCVTAPLSLGLAPLIAIVCVLLVLPTHVAIGMAWPVFAKLEGAGKLVIEEDAIELRWAGRTDRIARAGLRAEADVETLRLYWHGDGTDKALVVMPTGNPATRDGRIRQVEILAARLAP